MEIIECRTPLVKGGLYSPHTMHFYLVDHEPQHRKTLEKFGQDFDKFSQDLQNTAYSFYGSETKDPLTKSTTSQFEEREVYTTHFEGKFDIPWTVTTKIAGNRVNADYEVLLTRPDQSLAYKLRAAKIPEFYYPTFTRDFEKRKIRIDGLPVYLQVAKWGEVVRHDPPLKLSELPIDSIVAVISRGIPTREVTVRDGNTTSLIQSRKFEGSWDERWFVDKTNGNRVTSIDVFFKGNWQTKKKQNRF